KVSDAATAFRVLGATMVVGGTLERRDDGVHVTVTLVDSKRMRQIRAVELRSETGDLTQLENEATADLARVMRLRVPDDSGERLTTPKTYESYLKAVGLLARYDKPGNVDAAITAL